MGTKKRIRRECKTGVYLYVFTFKYVNLAPQLLTIAGNSTAPLITAYLWT